MRNKFMNSVRKMLENHIQKQQLNQVDEPATKRVKLCEEAETSSGGFFGELFNVLQSTDAHDMNCHVNSQGNIYCY